MKLEKAIMHTPRTLKWLETNGCELGSTLCFIYDMTKGDPCRECYCGSTCPALKKDGEEYQTHFQEINERQRYEKEHPYGSETNAEMAARLGITKRQAAKLRKQDN